MNPQISIEELKELFWSYQINIMLAQKRIAELEEENKRLKDSKAEKAGKGEAKN